VPRLYALRLLRAYPTICPRHFNSATLPVSVTFCMREHLIVTLLILPTLFTFVAPLATRRYGHSLAYLITIPDSTFVVWSPLPERTLFANITHVTPVLRIYQLQVPVNVVPAPVGRCYLFFAGPPRLCRLRHFIPADVLICYPRFG